MVFHRKVLMRVKYNVLPMSKKIIPREFIRNVSVLNNRRLKFYIFIFRLGMLPDTRLLGQVADDRA